MKKIIAVIPFRYKSLRFSGKPLDDLCGKPMIWWGCQQVNKVKEIHEVYIATDDERIAKYCEENCFKWVMSREAHGTSTERVYEVAQKVADLYIVINDDEPLINS